MFCAVLLLVVTWLLLVDDAESDLDKCSAISVCWVFALCVIDCVVRSAWKAHDARRLTGAFCFRRR